MKIAGYETHPAADLFPLLDGEELRALADDIAAHGLLNPIMLYAEEGKRLVLDGRNRLRACEMAGVAPAFEMWMGEGSPISWAVSQNVHRRHLDASQRAMVAAGLVPLYEGEAKERKLANLRNDEESSDAANLQRRGEKGRSAEKAAEVMNVSPRLVADAVVVQREAPAEVVEMVKRGEVAVSAAAKEIRSGKPSPFETRRPRSAATVKQKKEAKEPPYRLTLVMPQSAAARIVRTLEQLGFEGVGKSTVTSKDMRLSA